MLSYDGNKKHKKVLLNHCNDCTNIATPFQINEWSFESVERSLEQQKHIDLFVFSNLYSRWTHPKPENPRGAVTLMLGPMDST